jgi:hypothetical protein
VLLGRLKRTTDSAPGPARRKNIDSTACPGLVAWGEPRSNSTNYYNGIVNLNPTGGNQSDVDWTRLAACQDLAPHSGAPAVGSYSSYCSLQSTPSAISAWA